MRDEKRAPPNTTRDVLSDPRGFLSESLVLGGSQAILRQEAQGQRAFVGSDTLPVEISDWGRQRLESWGVRFLGPVPDDPLFQYAELPVGWKKVPTEHSMWSKLVDDVGKERAAIFYKVAFYDRRAHMSVEDC